MDMPHALLRDLETTPHQSYEWSHDNGDEPYTHPLWAAQVELERGMLRSGADRLRDRVIVAERRSQMTRTGPLRGLLHEWVPVIAQGLKDWIRDTGSNRGPRPIALEPLTACDPAVAALVTVREVLNGIAIRKRALTRLAMEIGRTVEHEIQIRAWEKQAPELFHHYREEMDAYKASQHHRRRVNINRFNYLHKQGSLQFRSWTMEEIFRVGITLIDVLVRTTGWFEIMPDPEVRKKKGRFQVPYVLAPKAGMLEWLAKSTARAEELSAEYKPTIMPPRRWEGTTGGGYWTPYVKAPRLVRFKASQEHQKERAADEYDALDFPGVYKALHVLQETPWRVQRRVLSVAKSIWAKDYEGHKKGEGVAGLPLLREQEMPPRTPRMIEHDEARKAAKAEGKVPPEPDPVTNEEILAWKRSASPVYRANARRLSRAKVASETILLADEYSPHDRFYFPHMLDFRGRMYPIPNFLQPQGQDLAKGLLEFADGVPITEDSGGAGWLAIQLASMWGNDKWPFDRRIQWVEENEEMWLRIAADPEANPEWTLADKPWQALAAALEWARFLREGYGMVSHLPVMVDGTCNGIQHLSALTRDRVSGTYVNLTPSEEPQDIYRFVAGELQEDLERISRAGGPEGEKADYWLTLTGGTLPRSLTKRQVMVLPYGGTRESFFDYTREWLDEHDPVPQEGLTPEEFMERTKRIAFMGTHMWYRVGTCVRGGVEVMEWLKKCAKHAAVMDQPIYWVLPSGFVVRHFYGVLKMRQVHTKLDGDRIDLVIGERSAKLSEQDQLRGIAPNFIHSLDAAALVGTIEKCREAGIEHFSAVHDAYGTHAANMWPMVGYLKQAFVELHEHDLLGGFRAACERVMVAAMVEEGMDPLEASQKADAKLPRAMTLGDLDIREVLESDYFFA